MTLHSNPLQAIQKYKFTKRFSLLLCIGFLLLALTVSSLAFQTPQAQANDDNVVTVKAKYNGGSDERKFNVCSNTWNQTDFRNKRTNSVSKLELKVTASYKDTSRTFIDRSKRRHGPYFNGPLTRSKKIEIYNSERDIFRGGSSIERKEGAGRFYAQKLGASCNGDSQNNDSSSDNNSDSMNYTGKVYNFNFGTDNNRLESHYQDFGEEFRRHNNGLTYGWTKDHRENVTESTNGSQNPAHNGLKGYAKYLDNNTGRRWMLLDIPDGYYEVEAISGTAHNDGNARHHVTANGDTVVFCDPKEGQQQWCEGRTRIKVTNNRIDIARGDKANNAVINLVRIRELR